MANWEQFLRGFRPRADLQETFYPEHVDSHKPTLLNTMPMLTAALVGARLLKVVSLRGGTRIKPSALDRLLSTLQNALPDDVVHHCEDEVSRILLWLEDRMPVRDLAKEKERAPLSDNPELDMMFAADIESRISVAEFALREGFDLELEYYEPDRDTWPRLRGTPVKLIREEEGDPDSTLLTLQKGPDETVEIPIKTLRWLMPVSRFERPEQPTQAPRGGRVLTFPGRRDEEQD